MFRGQFEHTIDAKGRLSIPARFREVLAAKSPDRLIVTKLDHCIVAYAVPDFEDRERRLAAKDQTEKVKAFIRFYVGGAHECEVDATGRILLPPPLRRHAALEKDAVLVGAIHRFEIWSAERWRTEDAKNEQLIASDRDFIPDI